MKDFLMDDDYDCLIANGDFVVGESTSQEIQLHLKASKGNYYQHPLTGIGIDKYINASVSRADLKRTIRVDLEADNMEIVTLDVAGSGDDFEMNVDAKRVK